MKQVDNLIFRGSVGILHAIVEKYCGLEVSGAGNLPSEGPALLVANHQSYLDVPVIGLF